MPKFDRVLVTGAAGFIGYHLCEKLLAEGRTVLGLDSMNQYYEPSLKEARLNRLQKHANFSFALAHLEDMDSHRQAVQAFRPEAYVNLAAQAGVRYSLTNPESYVASNLAGFGNVLELCRHEGVQHLVYASTSSVYGSNTNMPFSVHDNVDHPVSFYAATKKANELMAHSYSHLYRLPTSGLRFFTVYGPWGRPDMALFKFTKAILEGTPIDVYNHGKMRRDFTYIDDIVEGVARTIDHVATPNDAWDSNNPDPGTSNAPYRVYNIGNNNTVELLHFIEVLEQALGRTAEKNMMELQAGDVLATCANVDALMDAVGFRPNTPIEVGIGKFVDWYRDYYGV